MNAERLYTEQEISAMLKRAGELHSEQDLEETSGLTLSEIQQLAAEVGLDPQLLKRAARELDFARPDSRKQSKKWITSTFSLDRVIPGEFTDEEWPDIASEIGIAFGVVGSSTKVGRTYEWTYSSWGIQIQAKLTPKKGQTKVRIYGDMSKNPFAVPAPRFIFPVLYGLIAFMLSLEEAGLPAIVALGIGIAVFAGIHSAMHFGFRAWVREKERAAGKLAGKLDRLLASYDSIRESPRLESAIPESERIELPDDTIELDEESVARSRTRSRES